MSMGGSKYADRSELLREVPYAILPRYFDLNNPKSTPQFHRGVHYACLCRPYIWPRCEPLTGFKVLLQTLLRRRGRSYHAIVGYFEVTGFEEGEKMGMVDCRSCPRVVGCRRSSACKAPRYLKVYFESVIVFRDPYFLEPAEIKEIVGKEGLTTKGPPLDSISREEFYRVYGGVAYVWQRWVSYRVLRDRQPVLRRLMERALGYTKTLEVWVGEWPRIIEEVVEEVRKLVLRRKPKDDRLKCFKAALKFAGLSQYINVLVSRDCHSG
ncbi:MAG: hypothetical protein DRN04_16625 [Thermoprotei archaeon]|nr:MAG: hypothetical protein DRN04_16625 [Thermoprotei archaeon]